MFISIKTKNILPAVLLVAIAAAGVAINTYLSSFSSINKEIHKTSVITSRSVSQNLELWLNGFKGELFNLTSQSALKQALGSGFLAASAKKNTHKIFSGVVENQPAYEFIGLLKSDGSFVAASAGAYGK